ncbi:MAG TPA: methyltransferase domain-containing protein [Desulfomonilia bacterium]|jgi:trans-aconitate 2-methyltransferase
MKTRIGSINALYPMPVVLVGALVGGKPNFITVAHVGILNASAPHLVSIGLGKVHFTNKGIKENRTFSINIPSEDMMRKVDYAGLVSGKKTDKSNLFDITTGELGTAPMINECPVSMECKVVNIIELPTHDVFIGEITSTYSDESVMKGTRIDIGKIRPILFDMASRMYYSLGRPIGNCWDEKNRTLFEEELQNRGEEKTYKWNAHDYARNSSVQKAFGVELIEKMQLKGNESILDIGCGDGKLTEMIAERIPDGHVIGIDNSPDMISYAKETYSNIRNLKFMQVDAQKMLFDDTFDIAFSNAALHWVKDHKALLAGVKKGLKPGGRILFQMGGRGNVNEIMAAITETISLPEWKEYFKDTGSPYNFYGPDEYRMLLKHAGLEPVRMELIPKEMKFDSRDGLVSWVRTTCLPYTLIVPEDRRDAFIEGIVELYLSKNPADIDGTIHLKAVRLEIEATKPISNGLI